MTYPDGIDALVNVNAGDTLAAGGHAARHNSVNTALVEVKDYLVGALGSKLDLAGGKILQIVRATDSTDRSTTSTSFTDVTGMSVTITPQKSDSALIIISSFTCQLSASVTNPQARFQLTNSANTALSGAQDYGYGSADPSTTFQDFFFGSFTLLGYVTPSGSSSITHKLRFRSTNANTTSTIQNSQSTGQMYAIEVSA
jgi:hypothetical protein